MIEIFKTYQHAGVDIVAGDDASKILYEASKMTWPNRKGLAGEIASHQDFFSAVRFVEVSSFGNAVMGMNFDGAGTKVEIAERLGKFDTIAFDLFAMVCDDAAIKGGEPIIVGSVIDCNKISVEVIKELAQGMVEAANKARVVIINGEVAELGERIKGYGLNCINLGATALWIGKVKRMMDGKKILPGHHVIAFREAGLRSNGLSLVRKILQKTFGNEWHNEPLGKSTLGNAALHPSQIYTPLMVALTGGNEHNPMAEVVGFVHVTGGGVPGKLGRLLNATGYGAVLDNLFDPCELMLKCQMIEGVSDSDAYQTWNMGQGLLAVTPDPLKVIEIAEGQGFEAKIAGRIQRDPFIKLRSRGYNVGESEWVSFPIG